MTDPVLKTFEHLATSSNEFALPVLLHALDVADEEIRGHAVAAILRRGQKRGFAELIRRYDTLPDDLRERIDGSATRMREPLREALEKGKPGVRANAIRIIENSASYSQLEALLALVVENGELAAPAMQSVQVLVDRLFDELSRGGPGFDGASGRNHARQQALAALASAAGRAAATPFLNDLLNCVLVLGEADDPAVRNLLTDGDSAAGHATWQLLEESRHPGVMKLVASLLTNRIAADRLVEIIERRDDPEFVLQLLRLVPDRFSETLRANLQRVSTLAWIDPAEVDFDWVPPGLQGRLVELVSTSDVGQDLILDAQQWVVRNGGVIGRMAAVEALAATQNDAMERAIAEGLLSDDPEVQAWATSQLREHNIPQAFSLLIERLDSPLQPVRDAAREELESFDLYRMLDLYDHLKPHVCRRAGELIRKIDPETLQRLESELRSPLRSRRIRAVHGARAMGLHAEIAPVLLEMLHDDDHTILRAVIDALADLRLPDVRDELQRLRTHESPRIQRAAESVLRSMGELRVMA
jgi:hypothetical protein